MAPIGLICINYSNPVVRDPYLVYLNRIRRVNMHALQHPARRVGANGDCTQIKGPVLLPYLLEGATVASVTSKPEAL